MLDFTFFLLSIHLLMRRGEALVGNVLILVDAEVHANML